MSDKLEGEIPIQLSDSKIKAVFRGAPLSFRGEIKNDSKEWKYLQKQGFNRLVLLNQVHGSKIATFNDIQREQLVDADGFFLKKSELSTAKGVAFAIRTADCLPIFIETDQSIVLLHGGWRGVAAGICENALALIKDEKILTFAIGPSASKVTYEVEKDVLEQIPDAVFQPTDVAAKFLLDLPQTAFNKFRHLVSEYKETPCTILDPLWHSHRRDKENKGMNLLFSGLSEH